YHHLLSFLHDALPISPIHFKLKVVGDRMINREITPEHFKSHVSCERRAKRRRNGDERGKIERSQPRACEADDEQVNAPTLGLLRSEEHTSELQSRVDL